MQRRTTLKALGASVVGGAALGTSAAASDSDSDDGVELVDFETEQVADDDSEIDDEVYSVSYEGDGVVVAEGAVTYPVDCGQDVVFRGVESVEHGDVAIFRFTEGDEECMDVVTTVTYEATFRYDDGEADDFFVKHEGNLPER